MYNRNGLPNKKNEEYLKTWSSTGPGAQQHVELNQIANCENADGILPLSAFTRCQSQTQQSFCQEGILRFLLFADHLFSGQ